MTYDELVTKVRNYTETTSTVIDTTIVNDFISDAEYRIMTDVDLDVFRQNDFSTLTIGAPFLSTPTGILIIRYVVTYNDDGITMGPSSMTTNTSGIITISGLDAGTYDIVTTTADGCKDSATVTTTWDSKPVLAITTPADVIFLIR